MKSKINILTTVFTVVVLSYVSVQAADLENLIEGSTAESQVVASQQTRLSSAIESLLKKTTPDQNVFLRNIEKQDWKKALISWGPAFNSTPFEKTENAKALQGLVMFKTGLEISGVEKLFTAQNVKNIHSEIIQTWKDSLTDTNPVWEVAQIGWSDGWTTVFGRVTEVRNKLRSVDLKTDVALLKDMASKLPINTKERALVDWQLALSFAMNDKADEAAKIIGQLLKNKKSPYGEDLINLTAGRLLFQSGYFEAAAKYYEKIQKKSDYWLDAQEELAWTYLRKGETQNSIAISKSLMNSAFEAYLGPEPYFVESIGQLKVCDYPKVMEGLTQFPKRFKNRTLELNKLAKGEKPELVDSVLNKLRTEKISWSVLGKDIQFLPRTIIKDFKLVQLIESQKIYEKEAKVSEQLYADALALTGIQGTFQSMKNGLTEKTNKVKSAQIQRVKELAKNEVVEIKRILDKLHIVEAELVSQVEVADKIVKNGTGIDSELKKGTTGSKKSDAMVFVADSEVWFDEISNYKVDVKKGCQGIKK
jgi:tetratricopeptide (TPR) repeat protein